MLTLYLFLFYYTLVHCIGLFGCFYLQASFVEIESTNYRVVVVLFLALNIPRSRRLFTAVFTFTSR